ncbi:SAC3 family protein B isoform X1 [Rosa rugosa]|uniref:SAC3 family protein B isoform X1 n=1 Tax=Rosa rugosa TaxID=74645 RepID=UPI002B408B09|nr:SAC3 family protein B isoform X1 [Rosa rugosa]
MFSSFSSQAGPTGPAEKSPIPVQFGTSGRRPPSPSPTTPPFPYSAPLRSPSSGPEALGQPHLAFQSSHPGGTPSYRSAGVQRSPESLPSWNGGQRPLLKNNDTKVHQRPSAVTSFVVSRNSGTSVTAKVARFQDTRGTRSPPLLSRDVNIRNSTQSVPRSHVVSPRTQSPASISYNYQPVEDFNHVGAVEGHVVPPRTRSPPSASYNYHPVEDLDRFGGVEGPLVTSRTRSPPSGSYNHHPVEDFDRSGGVERHAFSSSGLNSSPKLIDDHARLQAYQEPSRVSPSVSTFDSGRRTPVNYDDVQVLKRTRPSVSPIGSNATSSAVFSTRDSRVHQQSLQSSNNTFSEAAANNLTAIPVAKRMRSPPLLPDDQVFKGNSYATQDGTEREMQAKAKRLARFKVELSKSPQSGIDIVERGVSATRNEQSNVERNRSVAYSSTQLARDVTDGNALSECEGVESSGIIIGVCPDMCPDSERAERERKGDLDRHERVDGDRNQTSMSLAVKKYNRTAERDANLIRPMPILQKTMDYLLKLLDTPYSDRFLSIYNFLWDRMRAIRMDLRMQHIFNQEAINMLEQMIRLHIIAMHELCEYSKGEGFAEGFDAHLNIEQMNKTSVELFQMYDDHRKKGISIPTEKEFRGYYALLKLDKHPGHMVEPAELSLDLAKMTPEIRQTSEVLFARDVARACRTGNFIAFFRLARKATYLQACLMHAHFAKLRTLALASLQAGLQNNQGLPIADVAKWLAMEEEEIESLSEYHGFQMKSYNKESYMVKEGPFLNGDEEYPTKCSNLVDMKKSRRIIEDVLASGQVISLPAEASKGIQLTKPNKLGAKTAPYSERGSLVHDVLSIEVANSIHEVDEEMANYEVISSPKDVRQKQKIIPTPIFSPQKDVRQKQHMIQTPIAPSPKGIRQKQQVINMPILGPRHEDDSQMASVSPSPWDLSSYKPQPDKVGLNEKPNKDALYSSSPVKSMHFGMEATPLQIGSKTSPQSPVGTYSYDAEHSVGQIVSNNLENEEPTDLCEDNENDDVMGDYQHEEIAEAKLKLMLRLWRRRSMKLRELREQKQLAANAALSSLSLGPPIQLKRDQPRMSGDFDIDLILRERHQKHGQSWSRLNVSDVIADTLSTRNPDARCLCWKVVVCSPMNDLEGDEHWQRNHALEAAPWLLSKIMPSKNDHEDLLISSPGVSIWKKWVQGQSGSDLTCCLSVVKDANSDNLIECVSGMSALLFLVSESIPWKLQKAQLHNLLMSVPYGSYLPLLILAGSFKNDIADPSSIIVDNMGLHDLDKSRISSFRIVPLVENQKREQLDGFYSDNRLREGLRWLASESPPQPILHHVKTHELILTHLNSSLEALEKMKDYEVGPNNCILSFNEALDQSQREIAAAAQANPASFPCPEIALLEEYSEEHRLVKWCLPSIGWSSVAKIEPLMSALGNCRLPTFPDTISWLPRCSYARKEIESLKVELENGLIRYLADSKMMGLELAIKEAYVMLQRSCRLECHDSCCYIVPKWTMIFRRIFNWRLMGLANGTFSSAYILECPHLNATFGNLGKLTLEDSEPSAYHLNQPTLDEVIEVCRSPLMFQRGQSLQETDPTLPETSPNGSILETPNTVVFMDDETCLTDDIEDVPDVNRGLENGGGELVVAGKETKEDNKLSTLLEHCNMLQNVIDKKLSIYF